MRSGRQIAALGTTLAIIILVSLAGGAIAYAAPGYGSGSLGSGGVGAGAGAPGGSDTSYTPSPPNPPPSDDSGYTWLAVESDYGMICQNGVAVPTPPAVGNQPAPEGGNGGPVGPSQFAVQYQLYGPNGQPVGAPVDECPGAAAAQPPPPPPPPTPAEVWSATPLPAPTFGFDPSTLGLTQLPTWFWLGGVGGEVTVTVNIRGYTVTTTARPAAYYWWFGDGASAVGQGAGSQSDPSVTHTYVTKASYQVEVIIAWAGQYTFAGNGVPAETVDLGTVDGPADTATYGVQEVRGVGSSG